MKVQDAFEIVWDLANQNALTLPLTGLSDVLVEVAECQHEALDVTHDFLVNHVYDGEE